MKRYLVILLIASLRFSSQAQTPDCLVFGVVKDIGTHEKLISVRAEALDMKWGRYVTAFVNDSGRYELHLGRNGEWLLTFGARGHVSKRLKILLDGIPEEEWEGGFGMNIDMTLLPEAEGIDYSLFDEPFGIARYNSDSARLEWDLAYTRSMLVRQKKLLKK